MRETPKSVPPNEVHKQQTSTMNLLASTQLVLASVSFLSRRSRSPKWTWKGTATRVRQYSTDPCDDETTTTTGLGTTQNYLKTYHMQGETTPENPSGITVSTDTGHVLQTDVPRKMGGKDGAPQPVETLLAAWIGCTQATSLFVGRQMKPKRLLLDRLVFDVHGERDERGALTLPIEETPPVPSRLSRISGTIKVYLKGGRSIEASELSVLQKQTELRCPVANMMMASGCHIDVVWIDGASSQG